MSRRADTPSRILAVRLSALGDVAMTLPVLYSAARQYPECEFILLTRPFFGRLAINAPANLSIETADFKKDYSGAAGTMRLLRRLAGLKPDAIADLHNVSRSWIIDTFFRLRGVKVAMVDKDRRNRRRLFEERESQRSYILRYADVFNRLGLPVSLDFRSVFPSKPDPPVAVKHPAAAIAPFARYTNKAYPIELAAQVARSLTLAGCSVYLFGGRGEEEAKLKDIADNICGCHCVAGRFPIERELELMANMDVMVSMDSANQHLASLTGIPVITLWGSTTPACGFTPYGSRPELSLCRGLECQPCTVAGSKNCRRGDIACLAGLSPATVVEKVLAVIDSRHADS